MTALKRLRVELPADYVFRPGQFAVLRVAARFVREWNRKYGTRHGDTRRAYSFASNPHRLPSAEEGWRGETGFVDAVLARHLRAELDAEALVAGSPVMMR